MPQPSMDLGIPKKEKALNKTERQRIIAIHKQISMMFLV